MDMGYGHPDDRASSSIHARLGRSRSPIRGDRGAGPEGFSNWMNKNNRNRGQNQNQNNSGAAAVGGNNQRKAVAGGSKDKRSVGGAAGGSGGSGGSGGAKKSGKPYAGIPASLLKCTVCSTSMWNGESFERHVKGRFHADLMQMVKAQDFAMCDVLRQRVKREEKAKRAALEKSQKGKAAGNGPLGPTVSCPMCDIDDACGPINFHRKSVHHQALRKFLHPKCQHCNLEFQTRAEYDVHRFSEAHLQSLHKAGITEVSSDPMDGLLQEVAKLTDKKPAASASSSSSSLPATKVTVATKAESEEDEKPSKLMDIGKEMKEKEEKELNEDQIMEYDIPDKEQNVALGYSLVKPVNGFFCCVCKKFFANCKLSDHCKTSQHYDKFVETVEAKKQRVAQKREALQMAENDDEGEEGEGESGEDRAEESTSGDDPKGDQEDEEEKGEDGGETSMAAEEEGEGEDGGDTSMAAEEDGEDGGETSMAAEEEGEREDGGDTSMAAEEEGEDGGDTSTAAAEEEGEDGGDTSTAAAEEEREEEDGGNPDDESTATAAADEGKKREEGTDNRDKEEDQVTTTKEPQEVGEKDSKEGTEEVAAASSAGGEGDEEEEVK